MKTCPNPQCNMSGIPDDARFCPKCGEPFATNVGPSKPPGGKVVDAKPKNVEKKALKALLLSLLIVVGIYLGVSLFVNLYLNPKIQREREDRDSFEFVVDTLEYEEFE